MWAASVDLPRGGRDPFYERLNRVLDEAGLDDFVESACAKFYAGGVGRPSLARAVNQLKEALQAEVLRRVLEAPPAFLEQIVVGLLNQNGLRRR